MEPHISALDEVHAECTRPPIATRDELQHEFRWLVHDALVDEVHQLGLALRSDVQNELQCWHWVSQGKHPIATVNVVHSDEELMLPSSPYFLKDPIHGMHFVGEVTLPVERPMSPEAVRLSGCRTPNTDPPALSKELAPGLRLSANAATPANCDHGDICETFKLDGSCRVKPMTVPNEVVEAGSTRHDAALIARPAWGSAGDLPEEEQRAGSINTETLIRSISASQEPQSPQEPVVSQSRSLRPNKGHHGVNSRARSQSALDEERKSRITVGDTSQNPRATLRPGVWRVSDYNSRFVPQEELSLRERYRYGEITLCEAATEFVKTDTFDYFMGILLMLNAVSIGVQVDQMAMQEGDRTPISFRVMDGFFCIVFAAELLIRALVFKSKMFNDQDKLWNMFDIMVVSFQVIDELAKLVLTGTEVQETIGSMGVLRLLRLARIIRLLRMVRLVPELKALVYLIAASMGAFLWTVALLLVLIYCVAVYYTELCTDIMHNTDYTDDLGREGLRSNFGSIGASVFSLFQAITGGDDWRNFVDPFRGLGQGSMMINSFAFAGYIAFASLVMLNLVTGVFVEGAQRMIQDEKDAEIVRHVRKLFNLTDVDLSGEISYQEFEQLMKTNSKAIMDILKCLDFDQAEGSKLFNLLDADRSGQIDVVEFVQGCMRLRGPARSSDLCELKYELDDFCFHLEERFIEMEKNVELNLECVKALLSSKEKLENRQEKLESQPGGIMQSAIVHVSEQPEASTGPASSLTSAQDLSSLGAPPHWRANSSELV